MEGEGGGRVVGGQAQLRDSFTARQVGVFSWLVWLFLALRSSLHRNMPPEASSVGHGGGTYSNLFEFPNYFI